MEKTITITIEQYECLRGHLIKAAEILNSIDESGAGIPLLASSKKPTKEKKSDRVKKYSDLISTGKRAKKPDNLKNNNI